MGSKLRFFLIGLAVLGLIASAIWWAIGPNWRGLIQNMPQDKDVLFWEQSQRSAIFRMMDEVSFLVESRRIEVGDDVRALPKGAPLDLPVDMEAYAGEQNLAGLIILHNGEIRHEQYGLGFQPDERWTSFSVAKSYTSTLVGAAILDGYIQSLDDPVSTYLPGLIGSAYDDVTIQQLLTMSSGVAWNEDYGDPNSDVAQIADYKSPNDLSDTVSYMKDLPRAHPPGEVWNYSTGETNLIGLLVRAVTGKDLATYLSEKVWAPYGMQQSGSWLLNDDGSEISGCCIQAATRDYARFGQYVLEDGFVDGQRTVPDGWFEQASFPHAEVDRSFDTGGYGYQWWIDPDGSFRAGGIFGQGIFIDPSRRLVIASNSNWTSPLGLLDGERERRRAFYTTVQDAIDAE